MSILWGTTKRGSKERPDVARTPPSPLPRPTPAADNHTEPILPTCASPEATIELSLSRLSPTNHPNPLMYATRALTAIYNSFIPSMTQTHAAPRRPLRILLLYIAFLMPLLAHAADWTETERQLSAKIAATTGPGAVSLEILNRAAFSKTDLENIRRGLASQLSTLGVQVVKPDQAAATVQVFLTQNLQDDVWIAEVRQGTGAPTILMVAVNRPAGPVFAAPRAPALTLSRTLLWSQESRILDVAVVEVMGAPAYLLVLDGEGVHISRFDNGHWKAEQVLAIQHEKPWPRDLRGRLVLRKDHLFDAYLPGVLCSSTGGASLTLQCREDDDPWPLSSEQTAFFAPNRNYFTGVLVPGIRLENSVAPFYSAVPVPRSNYTLWLFASIDGSLQLVDGMSKQSITGLGFGSDLAAIRSTCGSGWQVLATSNSDNAPDAVRAFEFPDREPVPASPVLEFAGPITSLWSDNNSSTAVAVNRNLDSGRYEAYRLSVACGQ
jgi:hypothetical protein